MTFAFAPQKKENGHVLSYLAGENVDRNITGLVQHTELKTLVEVHTH